MHMYTHYTTYTWMHTCTHSHIHTTHTPHTPHIYMQEHTCKQMHAHAPTHTHVHTHTTHHMNIHTCTCNTHMCTQQNLGWGKGTVDKWDQGGWISFHMLSGQLALHSLAHSQSHRNVPDTKMAIALESSHLGMQEIGHLYFLPYLPCPIYDSSWSLRFNI